MKIGELAKASGIPAHTIRFYESKGLLPNASRGLNGYRVYDENSLETLSRIICAKRLGFSLDDMLTIMADSKNTDDLDHDKLIHHLDSRLNEVEIMMKDLMKQREEIKAFKAQLLDSWAQGECLKVDGINQRS